MPDLRAAIIAPHCSGWAGCHARASVYWSSTWCSTPTPMPWRSTRGPTPGTRIEHFAAVWLRQVARAVQARRVIAAPDGCFATELGDGMIAAVGLVADRLAVPAAVPWPEAGHGAAGHARTDRWLSWRRCSASTAWRTGETSSGVPLELDEAVDVEQAPALLDPWFGPTPAARSTSRNRSRPGCPADLVALVRGPDRSGQPGPYRWPAGAPATTVGGVPRYDAWVRWTAPWRKSSQRPGQMGPRRFSGFLST